MFFTNYFHSTAPPSSSHGPDQLVHQLWPPEDNVCCIDFNIVFFHGVRKPGETEAWKNTWVQHTTAQDFWVKDWLPQDLDGNVRVLALSYDSCAIRSDTEGNLKDVTDLGSHLLHNVVFSNRWRLGQQCGCLLVGHSFGGLVIKSLVVEAYQIAQAITMNRLDELQSASANRFLKNLRGVVNYAVPHDGSCLESYFSIGHNLFHRLHLAKFMENLRPFQRKMEDLSIEFNTIVDKNSILVYAFLEGKPLKALGKMMVNDASAVRGARNNYFKLEDCDHFTICQPSDKSHPSYCKLVEVTKYCQQQDHLQRHLSFSSEVPQELPNITNQVPSQYLDLAANSLMHIQSLISPESANLVPINQLQCQYLSEKLCETLKGVEVCIQDASLQHIQESRDTLKSLAQLAKEAEKLIQDCCDDEWIQAAMIFANAKEHFASLTFKLRMYMQLLQSIFKEGATKNFLTKLHDRKWSDDVKDEEFHIIDEIAKEDEKRLLSRLTQVGSSDSENLIKRLKISSNRATFLHDNATSVIDAWKVGYKSIQRVPNGQIGKGGSATVHKVMWLGKHFAEKSFDGPETEDIRKEASLLAGLSHPNILPLFCYATRDHSCSLVMELMDESLQQLMARRLENNETCDAPFEILEAVDIMLQVAEGMNYLYQNRVVHRDLKSMNILVKCNEPDGHVYVKVADFGLSKRKESSCTYSNLTMDQGTTRWMAPELFCDSKNQNVGPSLSIESRSSLNYHFKVDVYSFGMMCYEILTGRVPFVNFKLMDLRKRIKDGLRPDIPEQCPEQLSTLIQACYHPGPASRPSFPDICVELRHIMCSIMVDSTL